MNRFSMLAAAAILIGGSASAQHGRAVGRMGTPPPASRPAQAQAAPQGAGRASGAAGQTALSKSPVLAARLQSLLPAQTTLDAASEGFKNQGQFIAALHVSHNLNIPFADLKQQMTGPDGRSLGDAIRTLKPDMPKSDVRQAQKTAEQEARQDQEAAKAPESK